MKQTKSLLRKTILDVTSAKQKSLNDIRVEGGGALEGEGDGGWEGGGASAQ